MDATFESMKAGTISPATAMQAVSGLSGNTPGEYDDDLYEMKLLDKIKDNIVPDAYKPSVTKFHVRDGRAQVRRDDQQDAHR